MTPEPYAGSNVTGTDGLIAVDKVDLDLQAFQKGYQQYLDGKFEDAYGTWRDPQSVSSDERADNTLVIVEYGEVEGEWVGHGIVTALGLINNLEVNEQVLYARMENVEESTLIV